MASYTVITVYKIGGSALALDDLANRIQGLVAQRPNSRPLFVVGGGETADIVRRWDRLHQLGDERAHWLALQAMMLNEALVLELLPEARLVHNREEAELAWKSSRLPILCSHSFLQAEELQTDSRLPHTWEVTSDSIAGWIVIRWPADELVLLKATALPQACSVEQAIHLQLVDPHFQQLTQHIPRLGWVNLRADQPTIDEWHC